ncbi:IclR family transcriptional regulator [Bordetella parapertussis]|uniref:Transcriptional regulator n=6 Tax=Bordetella TaxID=517 RepID=Q7WBG1_BORPA|nr:MULTISPECIES: IclR family transcriptional regulator [Bordetella]KCV34903.1 IclR helix-turn-helix domain protein [Bordetella bronchiseptica 00-P-2730]SHR54425.1 regulatory protein IclR [Mycobacteroides abscessus subsp. abscessus]AOB38316.1 IclR family transcriptional regulator [Bordetella parapertussis]AUL14505.1 IclR family transcriptional regulator [Bordetella bronchiseptica]AUL42293.1 IclR family transcriptional regulator [Bordetella parapertussis]
MSNDGVVAVERALAVLDCFKPGDERLGLAEFAARLPLHKTTIFRLLNSLARCGYVLREPDGRYSLGPRVLYLARVYERGFNLSGVVMPVLESLSGQTGESAAYYVEGDQPGQRLCLFRHQPYVGLHSQVLAGSVMPPDRSSTGRVFAVWAQGQPGGDERLPFFSCGARDPYTSSWSVPVVGDDDRFVGALTVAGPSERLRTVDVPRFERLVLEHADDLARRLGASATIRAALYGD